MLDVGILTEGQRNALTGAVRCSIGTRLRYSVTAATITRLRSLGLVRKDSRLLTMAGIVARRDLADGTIGTASQVAIMKALLA